MRCKASLVDDLSPFLICCFSHIPLFDSKGSLEFPYGFIPPRTPEYDQAIAAGYFFVPHLSLGDESCCSNWASSTHAMVDPTPPPPPETTKKFHKVDYSEEDTLAAKSGHSDNIFMQVLNTLVYPVTMWLPNANSSHRAKTPPPPASSTPLSDASASSPATNGTPLPTLRSPPTAQSIKQASSNQSTLSSHTPPPAAVVPSSSSTSSSSSCSTGGEEYASKYLWFAAGIVVGSDRIFKYAKRLPNHPAM